MALAEASLTYADQAVLVLPRVFPHKAFDGATFDDRIRLLLAATANESRFSVAASQGGLFIEIAEELLKEYASGARLLFVCGADAAHRIVNWNYGEPGAFSKMLERFELLVAARGEEYSPPAEMHRRIQLLPLNNSFATISASEVRRRIRDGEDWEGMVPPAIVPLVRQIYR